MTKVTFTKSTHKYEGEGKVYRSVTNLISQFKQPFDKEFWSEYKAYESLLPHFDLLKKEYKKKYKRSIRDKAFLDFLSGYVSKGLLLKEKSRIQIQWKNKGRKASHRGTVYHDGREQHSYRTGEELNPRTGKKHTVHQRDIVEGDNSSWTANLYDLEDGFYPELLLWNSDYLLAGQADRVFIESKGKVRYVDIGDYKTNEKLPKESYFDWSTKTHVMMKRPVEHLQDCKFVHYCLQLSMYAWLLEQYGFAPRHLTIHHLNELHEVPYMRDDILAILNTLNH